MFIKNNTLYIKKRLALVLLCLFVAITATIFFAANIGIIRSHASEDVLNTFQIKQNTATGQQMVPCTGKNCTIQSLDLDIEFDPQKIEHSLE